MHVLHLTIPFEYSCGITRHVWCLAREQRNRYRVTVVTSGGAAVELLEADGVRWLRLPVDPQEKSAWRAARAIHALRRYVRAEGVSVLHAHHRYHALLGRVVSALAGGTPLVSTCHYLAPGRRRFSYSGSHVIAVSEATRRFLTDELHVPDAKVSVIPHCVPPRLPLTDSLDPRLALTGERPLIVAIGRLSPEKGFETLVRAMSQLPSLDPAPVAVIIGEGPLRGRLEVMAAELAAPVLFTGSVRGVHSYLERAAVVVQPSLTETASLSLLEAGAYGRAVVASAVGGLGETVRHLETGLLVPPGDTGALATAIARMLTDEQLRARLGALLRDSLTSRLDPAPMTDAVSRVYATAGAG